MKIYLAAPFETREAALGPAAQLIEAGHEVTSRWLTEHTSEESELTPEAQAIEALEDLQDVWAARVVVLLTFGPFARLSAGKHVELGYALGIGNDVLVVGPPGHIFHYAPGVHVVPDMAACLALLEDSNQWL